MQAVAHSASTTNVTAWPGRVISALVILFLLLDGVIKLIQHPQAVQPTTELGFAASLVQPLGFIGLACLLLYAIPRTSILGVILLTGYLGGAVAIHLRAEDPLFTLIFPVILGVLAWGGLFLQDRRLQALMPLRRPM